MGILAFAAQFGAVAIGTGYLLSKYANFKTVSWFVIGVTYLGWLLAFAVIILVPVDSFGQTYSCSSDGTISCESELAYVTSTNVSAAWTAAYWISWFLTWFIIPWLQIYVQTANFTIRGRIWTTIKDGFLYYCSLIFLCAIFVGVYIGVTQQMTITGISSITMAVANAFGLVIVMGLLGRGLVSIPRSVWRQVNNEGRLRYLAFKIPTYKIGLDNANTEVDRIASEIHCIQRSLVKEHKFQKYLKQMLSCIGRGRPLPILPRKDPSAVSEEMLNNMNKRLKQAIRTRGRRASQLNHAVLEALEIEDTIANSKQGGSILDRHYHSDLRVEDKSPWRYAAEYWYKVYMIPICGRFVAILFALISLLILYSEFTIWLGAYPGNLEWILAQNNDYMLAWSIKFFIILYMVNSTYMSLLKCRIANIFYLVGHNQTDGYSLLFSANYICFLSFPLCLNFLHLVGDPLQSAFGEMMKPIKQIPVLGNVWGMYVPTVVVLFSFATALRLWNKLMGYFCFEGFIFDEPGSEHLVDGGREMINLARAEIEKCVREGHARPDISQLDFGSRKDMEKFNPPNIKIDIMASPVISQMDQKKSPLVRAIKQVHRERITSFAYLDFEEIDLGHAIHGTGGGNGSASSSVRNSLETLDE